VRYLNPADRSRHKRRGTVRQSGAIEEVAANDEVGAVVAELWVVEKKSSSSDSDLAPGCWRKRTWIGGQRPADYEELWCGALNVAQQKREEPAVGGWIPLNLGIAVRITWRTNECVERGGTDEVEAAVVDSDVRVVHLDIVAGADCTGRVRWCLARTTRCHSALV
jgi:hypothetical protein